MFYHAQHLLPTLLSPCMQACASELNDIQDFLLKNLPKQ